MENNIYDKTISYYLNDLGFIIKERAREAKKIAKEQNGKEFEAGIAMAYFEIITLMQQQAIAFNLSLECLNLHDINPEKELT